MQLPDSSENLKARQEALVERIVTSLRNDAKNDADYRKTFGLMAAGLIQQLCGRPYPIFSGPSLGLSRITTPINLFTKNEPERSFLIVKVLEKLVAGFASSPIGDYMQFDLEEERID